MKKEVRQPQRRTNFKRHQTFAQNSSQKRANNPIPGSPTRTTADGINTNIQRNNEEASM